MSSILMAAVLGAVGGAAGGVLAWGVEKGLGRRPRWLVMLPVMGVALALGIGRALGPSDTMAEMDSIPAVAELKRHYPDDYHRIEAAIAQARSTPEAAAAVDGVITAAFERQRGKADANSALLLYGVARDDGRALREVDPAACAAFMDGRGGGAALAKVLTPTLIERDRQATAKMLAQTATTPAPPAPAMTLDELLKLSMEAVATLPDAEQDVAIRVMRERRDPATPDEAKATCDFDLALADVILSREPATAGELVRRLWAASSASTPPDP